MRINGNGNVGIGTTAPTYPLHVSTIQTSGTVSIWAAGDIQAFSDRRVKGDLEVIPDAMAKVEQISGYTYVRTDVDTGGRRQAGFIAQEVEAVLPEVVATDEQGFKSVAYGNVSALLVQAIKELSAKIDEISVKNEMLSTKMEELATKVKLHEVGVW